MLTSTVARDDERSVAGHGALVVDQLTVCRDGRSVLTDASVRLDCGTLVAVTGPSGSGKSTLLAALAGLIRPERGTVAISEHSMWPAKRAEQSRLRRNQIGLVMQFGELFPELTVLENVELPLLLQRRPNDERPCRLLAQVGIGHLAGSYPGQLSGGERQRAAIARALVTRPSVVLADELTGSLDTDTTRQVFAMFRAEVLESKSSALVCTHDPWVAAQCDSELVIESGRLVSR